MDNINTITHFSEIKQKKFIITGDREMTRKFKPSQKDKKIKLNIIPPNGGINVQDVEEIDKILFADVWEGNIKIGRYRLSDIKIKFK
jgi:hypothetical protein